MCGIAGFVDLDALAHRDEVLRCMTDQIVHRGPDEAGHLVDGATALGMRRLSIIDIAGGSQPITTGGCTIVYNGEVYNHDPLREELQRAGHRFQTRSDTEVVLHAYQEHGVDSFQRLHGMFAIAILDRDRGRLVLARDRFGKKPLFYAEIDGGIVFGSEVKTLLQHPGVQRDLEPSALLDYLTYDCVPSPRSIMRGMHKLDAGCFLTFDLTSRELSIGRYWSMSYAKQDAPPTYADAVRETRARIRAATTKRLVSDVPLGVFLSGGLDSSSVAAALVESGHTDVQTFAVGFEEASYDESREARRVAEHLGTTHHERIISASDLVPLVPRIADWFDEPVSDPSVLPTFALSEFAREHVTVALGGDGGDETFAGYPTYSAHRYSAAYASVPGVVRKGLVHPLIKALPKSDRNFSLEFKARRFVSGADEPLARRHAIWMGGYREDEARALLTTELRDAVRTHDPYASAEDLDASCDSRDWVDRIRYQDLSRYLKDVVLVKVDRASMAASLEVRAPLLDHDLVEWVASLPPDYVFRRGATKRLLKDSMRDLLPEGIADREKKGFGIPVAAWLRGPLRELLTDCLSADHLQRQGIFDPDAVERLVRSHLDGSSDQRKQLWPLLTFQLWHARWAA